MCPDSGSNHRNERGRWGVLRGKVDFGAFKEVLPRLCSEARVGDYVVVHVGFAIARLDEAEASRVFEYLDGMGELTEG
jgi:hydrogenase expression/formation protein HypC